MKTATTFSRTAILPLTFAALLCTLPTLAQDQDGDTISDAIEQQLGSLPAVPQKLTPIVSSPDRGDDETAARLNAPDIRRLEGCHVGRERLLLKCTFARKPDFVGATFILYLDLDNNRETGRADRYHGGTDVMLGLSGNQISVRSFSPSYQGNTKILAAVEDKVLWICMETPLRLQDGLVEFGVHLLSQRKGEKGDSTSHTIAKLPAFPNRKVPGLKMRSSSSLRPLSDYRWFNKRVKLEKLSDKGLRHEQVAPKTPMTFGRARPPLPFSAARKPGHSGRVTRRRIPINLLEEAGEARSPAFIKFGFPFPSGAVFDLRTIRVLNPAGTEVPSQRTVTSFWPDNSLKWVLIDFATALAAREERSFEVEFGSEVEASAPASKLHVKTDEEQITVITGPLRAVIGKKRFNILRGVWLDRDGDGRFSATERVANSATGGIRLKDELGRVFTAANVAPESVTIEEQGPVRVVVRAEGDYADADGNRYMHYVSRLTFRAGSPCVTVAHTHINTYLDTEFTDVTSLELPFEWSEGLSQATFHVSGASAPRSWDLQNQSSPRLFQLDDLRYSLQPEGGTQEGHCPGTATFSGVSRGASLVVHEFRERWPKALTAAPDGFTVELLPEQPGPDFGKDLPHYLRFPFVEGKYRFKWGMSFTERITLDFSGKTPVASLRAEANQMVVAVLPAAWHAETKALAPLAIPQANQFAQWDSFIAKSFAAHMARKERNREYGYLNYGDWYGERGRNWGNNEYDLAHGLFMQFARTGERAYYRWALTAARHQADVDCVHAYPDRFYVGANHQHSIGHTGTWSQVPARATWSHRYDAHTAAMNGHTWAEGMIDAWSLAGEPRVMEAALGLGEHITWAMSKSFTKLGTHERSAGWSLSAILAIYRATGDPLYLEAADHIAEVALQGQKFDDGGAWPHPLPRDHAGGHRGARGNNLFLIGILLSGLEEYHAVTGRQNVRESIIAGTRWVIKSWDERAAGWPYSAATTGEPFYPAKISLNPLVVKAVAYTGHLTGEEKFIHITETAMDAVVQDGPQSFGKSLAQKMVFSSTALALLQKWYTEHGQDEGLAVMDGTNSEKRLLRIMDSDQFQVRAPDEKLFLVRRTGDAAKLTMLRRPHGAKSKDWPTGTLEVRNADAAVLVRDEFSTDGKHEFRSDLPPGKPGDIFRVVIRDDQRSVWNVAGENVSVMAQTSADFRIGSVGRARFHFFVPRGTKTFQIRLLGVHGGVYGGAVLSPEGEVVESHEGENPGQVQLPWARKTPGTAPSKHPERGELRIHPTPEQTGKVWAVVLWAAGDIGCELLGIPPYLALHRDDCFELD